MKYYVKGIVLGTLVTLLMTTEVDFFRWWFVIWVSIMFIIVPGQTKKNDKKKKYKKEKMLPKNIQYL